MAASCMIPRGGLLVTRQQQPAPASASAAACCPPPLQRLCRPAQPQQLQQQQRRPALRVAALLTGRTSNPAFGSWANVHSGMGESRRDGGGSTAVMTVQGTLNRAGLLMLMSMVTAAYTWMQIFSGNAAAAMGALGSAKALGAVGIGAAIASMFKPQWSPVTAPVYAVCKGVALAAMSAVLEMSYPGIAMNAVVLTFSTALSLFAAVRLRIIRITDKFADTVRAVTGGYLVAIMLVFLGSLVGLRLPGLFSGGPLGIGVSMVASGLAAANLLLDLDWIEKASFNGAPGWMAWYGAQALMISTVWMYTEVLKLLMLAGGRGGDE